MTNHNKNEHFVILRRNFETSIFFSRRIINMRYYSLVLAENMYITKEIYSVHISYINSPITVP